MLFSHFGLLCASVFVSGSSDSNDTATLIYQYDPITWVENLAVRPNGSILPITTTSPRLNQLDPRAGTLQLVHDFSDHGNAIQGITAVGHDSYAVDVLTCNITALTCTSGSVTTWLVSFSIHQHGSADHTVTITEVTQFLQAGFLNGIAALNSETLLLADSFLGGIWSLAIATGVRSFLFTDSSMAPTAEIGTGINGLRVRPGLLYYTTSAQGTFNVLPIDPSTGNKTGEAIVLASGLAGPDDFEINDDTGEAYVCNGALNQILRIPIDERNVTASELDVLAEVPGPTSVRWGSEYLAHGGERLRQKLVYVSTVGGLAQYTTQNVTFGGAVYSIAP
ncbi:hypothetical protein LTR78_010326 [Recurvomyces mirabilis]|uniref:Uncharacterized protein n=1 Tax=Recurvomyces mirabilis TaxID=574656 RepID=A0AAE0TMI3_9PEZI|nr:hypothetical protein LTR78_010326 [Recurvomyces mirabilis]KAK5149860.1 hypothetical protein LTS14_010575 [Recurvomyces mirabilis]